MLKKIVIKGAKEHNLKNVSLEIPKEKLVVITGLSGSGKSSLAFDTIYAEGQRRYVESLSSYARQFLDKMKKPKVDLIEGLSPAISIEQKNTSEKSSLEIWKDGLSNVMPHVEVRSRRIGGATFQIPMQIRPDRKISLAMKWLISFARKRNEKSMAQKLAGEIIAAEKEEGAAVKKRTDTHKMAEANKAFSHFRF